MKSEQIPEKTRKEIFAAVVEAEDSGERPKAARELVARQFGVTESDVGEIEEEGINKTWPPLSACAED